MGSDDAPEFLPVHRRLLAAVTDEALMPLFPPPAADVDCSDFLTGHFMAETSPGRLRYCKEKASPVARDADENTALHLAALHGKNPAAIDAIIAGVPSDRRKDFIETRNRDDLAALHLAARHAPDPALVTALLAHGADPNTLAHEGRARFARNRGTSALHRAVRHDNDGLAFAITALLLAADADMAFQTGSEGYMALHLAAIEAEISDVIWLLLEAERKGAGITEGWREHWLDRKQDDHGRTALHFLANTSNVAEAFEIALEYGMSPDAEGEGGRTPLIEYAENGRNMTIMHRLLDASDEWCHASNEGATALAYARENNAFEPRSNRGDQIAPRDRLLAECSR